MPSRASSRRHTAQEMSPGAYTGVRVVGRGVEPPATSVPVFRSRFLPGARIKGMGTSRHKTSGDATDSIDQLRGGDHGALAELFEKHRDRLRRMVKLRLDAGLRAPTRPVGRRSGGVPRR
jgi:hypothetical protein